MSKPEDFVIENSVLKKYVGTDTEVVIPDSVTSIGYWAFSGCKRLTSITIPEGVTGIGGWAFDGCKRLTSITIPDSVTSIGDDVFTNTAYYKDKINWNDGVLYICNALIKANNISENYFIKEGTLVIADSAFAYCSGLTSITIPDSVTSIGNYAFRGCSSLESITIPEGVASIGKNVFSGCTSLTSITIPDSVTSIGGYAFWDCRSLTSITIPEGVTSIDDDAFRGCSRLTSITIPDSVTSIGGAAFRYCTGLTSITIPDSVTSIGGYAFCDCQNLTSITIPDSVTSIGERAFSGCISLKNIVFEDVIKQSKIKLSPDYFAYISDKQRDSAVPVLLIYQTGKKWRDNLLSVIDKSNADKIIKACIDIVDSMPKISSKQAENVFDIAVAYHKNIETETLFRLSESLSTKKQTNPDFDRIVKKLNKAENAATEQDSESSFEALEEIADNYDIHCAEYQKAQSFINSGFRYKNSDERCSKQLAAVLLAEYIKIWKTESNTVYGQLGNEIKVLNKSPKSSDTEITAKILECIEISEFVEFLKSKVGGKDYRYFIIPFAKYGTEKDILWFVSEIKKDKKGKAQARYKAGSAEHALMVSDTKAAVMYFEKAGMLYRYAKVRKTDEDSIKLKYLYDFNFDKDGKKIYDLGAKTIELRLNKDLSLTLYDTQACKEVKSIPKKDSDAKKYEAAKEDFASKKTTIKKVAKSVCDNLFGEFLSGKTYAKKKWDEQYSANPVLKIIAGLVVWTQNGKTFTVTDNGLIDADGNSFELTDSKIFVAHPMEVGEEVTKKWQKYFVSNNLKQPFDQVWEPVIDFDKFNKRAFDGCEIPLFRFNGQEKHGITFETEKEFDHRAYEYYYEDIQIGLVGCSFNWEMTTGDISDATMQSTITVESFDLKEESRQTNHIIVYLNKCTVYGRIAKDDDSVLDNLEGYTVAQIDSFLKFAIENNATKCTAAFLNYKNEHFADFADVDEFTLDF